MNEFDINRRRGFLFTVGVMSLSAVLIGCLVYWSFGA